MRKSKIKTDPKRDQDAEMKYVAAANADKRRQVLKRELGIGDSVLLAKKKTNKLSSVYESEPYKITAGYVPFNNTPFNNFYWVFYFQGHISVLRMKTNSKKYMCQNVC